jgi:hypothetical protein
MLHEGCKHFEASTMELTPFVFEEKPESTIPNCKKQLPFPHPTYLLISKIGGQGCIGVACGEFRHAEIKLDLLQQVEKSFRIFNRVELEELSTNPKRSNVRNETWRMRGIPGGRDRRSRGTLAAVFSSSGASDIVDRALSEARDGGPSRLRLPKQQRRRR